MKILLTAILTLLIFTGCSEKTTNETTETTQEESPKKTPNGIVLQDTSGQKIKVKSLENGFIFEGYENKIVLVNFFATWCPPCKATIPHLNNLQEKYKKDLKIISILLEENKSNEDVINFINNNDIEFTITNSKDNYKLAKAVGGVKSIPFMLIYDRNGKYSQHYTGAVLEEMIEADIKKVL
ncbi:MAG TPA: TlpA family protein disulfide reductase [Sulfurospirillum arcachonense]|nr:TlpA family protein disulfide reductase [Sulfurospirillum arcachonense]